MADSQKLRLGRKKNEQVWWRMRHSMQFGRYKNLWSERDSQCLGSRLYSLTLCSCGLDLCGENAALLLSWASGAKTFHNPCRSNLLHGTMPPRLRAPSSRMLEPLFVLVLQLSAVCIQAQLLVGFYDSSCPRAESIVQQSVMMAIQSNRPLASRLVRLFFHDCFVQGCDASILLDSTPNNTAEKDSRASATVGGYEVIDAAKNTLEAVCPGTVSCADVVALAARDAIFFSGGPHWDVPTGRRDGLVSQASVVASNLPDPSFNVDQSTASFSAKGLSQSDLVVLSGAHTIGFAHCGAIMNRFSANGSDPTLDPTFGKMLESSCPSPSPDATKLLPLDVLSNTIFDNAYFVNLQAGKGLMSSDQALFTDPRTKPLVNAFAQNANSFSANFQLAMVRLGQVQVKTGSDGQIRKNCRAINS